MLDLCAHRAGELTLAMDVNTLRTWSERRRARWRRCLAIAPRVVDDEAAGGAVRLCGVLRVVVNLMNALYSALPPIDLVARREGGELVIEVPIAARG
jgi:hypothetical protein